MRRTRDPAPAGLLDLLEEGEVDALLVDDIAAGVRAGHHGRAELLGLLDGVDGHVAGAGDRDGLALQRLAAAAQHLGGEQDRAVAGGLRTGLCAAPAEALAGEDAGLVAVGDPLVLTEEIADLAAAHTDVTGRNVGVLPQVAVEFGHEGLTEPHDLGVGPALGVEVRAALAAADGHAGEGVLEDLLEAEELHDAEVDRGVEAQPALVGAERAGELHPEAAVDVDVAGVVRPRHPEDQLALGLAYALDDARVDELGAPGQHRPERLQDLADRLVELLLTLIAAQDLGVERLDDAGRGIVRAGGVGRVGDDRHLIKTFRGRLVRVGAPAPGSTTGPPPPPEPHGLPPGRPRGRRPAGYAQDRRTVRFSRAAR